METKCPGGRRVQVPATAGHLSIPSGGSGMSSGIGMAHFLPALASLPVNCILFHLFLALATASLD